MKKFVVSVLIALFAMLPVRADVCYNECMEETPWGGCLRYQWNCYPEFYVVQTTEPDWCLYNPGDVVWTNTYVSGGQTITDKWYVIPFFDPDADNPFPIHSCCSFGRWFVSSPNNQGQCYIYQVW